MHRSTHLCPVDWLIKELSVRDQFAVSRRLTLAATGALASVSPTLRALSRFSTGSRAHFVMLWVAVAWTGVWVITELPELPAVAFLTVSRTFSATFAEQSIRVTIWR